MKEKDFKKTTTAASAHYKWGSGCDGWHLLNNERLSIIEEKMPPGSLEQMHFHAAAQQFFYILAGTATFILEGKELIITARESLYIPAGVVHNISNRSRLDLEFLVVSEPPSHGDRENVIQE